MMKYLLTSCLCAAAFGCVAPQATQPVQAAQPAPAQTSDETAHLKERVAQLQAQVDTLNNRVGHLQSDIEAGSADNEFTTMAVDDVKWSDPQTMHAMGGQRMLLLHPVEWRGYGKMKRFTDKSDHVLYLEAEGKPTVQVVVAVGGICNSDGSTRYVMAQPASALEPGVSYRLVPRNENDTYKWSTSDALVVSTSTPTR